jgi:DNA-binding transcriptional ArsR family regulator
VALLGRTRAAMLEAVGEGGTTIQLARRAGTWVPSASQHAQVLRQAGLLVTRRVGKSVHHSLTTLGAALLNQTSPAHPEGQTGLVPHPWVRPSPSGQR